MSKEQDKHYRTISRGFAIKNHLKLAGGYIAAHKVEGALAEIEGDPGLFFADKQYCVEDVEQWRNGTGDPLAYAIGYTLGREACKDAQHPPRTLADFFREEGL